MKSPLSPCYLRLLNTYEKITQPLSYEANQDDGFVTDASMIEGEGERQQSYYYIHILSSRYLNGK